MRPIYYISYLLCLTLLISACQKIKVEAREDGEPVFKLKMNFNGEAIDIRAGDNGYTLQTASPLTFLRLPYIGILGNMDAQQFNQLQLAMRIDESVANAQEKDHLNSFKLGELPFYQRSMDFAPIAEVEFGGDYIGDGANPTYVWEFGDGGSAMIKDAVHDYGDAGSYDSSLLVEDDRGCRCSVNNTIRLDASRSCIAEIDVTSMNNNNAVLEAQSSCSGDLAYRWTDGQTSQDISLDVSNISDLTNYCVTITDDEGFESVNCIGLYRNASGDMASCRANTDLTYITETILSWQFNAVSLTFWDSNGNEWETSVNDILQPTSSSFEVLSFEEFEPNELGNRTVKVEFRFSAEFYSGSQTVYVEDAEATMAVSIP